MNRTLSLILCITNSLTHSLTHSFSLSLSPSHIACVRNACVHCFRYIFHLLPTGKRKPISASCDQMPNGWKFLLLSLCSLLCSFVIWSICVSFIRVSLTFAEHCWERSKVQLHKHHRSSKMGMIVWPLCISTFDSDRHHCRQRRSRMQEIFLARKWIDTWNIL